MTAEATAQTLDNMDRAVYTVKEVAELMGLTEKAIYDMVRRNDFKHGEVFRRGSVIRFSKARIDKLLGLHGEKLDHE